MNVGFATETISGVADIDGSKVSRELNNLVRKGRVIEIMRRPVKYLDKESIEGVMLTSCSGNCTFDSIYNFL